MTLTLLKPLVKMYKPLSKYDLVHGIKRANLRRVVMLTHPVCESELCWGMYLYQVQFQNN